ncbi:MAG: primosomal protein N' [Armatimonadetes bacterium]|nr:primosomal protein N' [Armatimonadota bacterium]
MNKPYAQVLIDRPGRSLDRAFSYLVPDELRARVAVGSYVLVPFGAQQLPGFVTALTEQAPPGVRLRAILGLLLDYPLFDAQALALAEWLSREYVAPLADALRLLLPPGSGRKTRRVVCTTAEGGQRGLLIHLKRAPRQQAILRELQEAGGELQFEVLLKGLQQQDAEVTPSMLESAVGALVKRGYVVVRRELQRPTAQALERQVASLVESDQSWDELLDELQERAPRQAEVIATLLATQDMTASVAELNREAVQGLVRKGLVSVHLEVQEREPQLPDWEGTSAAPLQLNPDQAAVYQRAETCLATRCNAELLVHGVTGSGKTEIYLHCADLALRLGRSAIVLVPEISLTPQMVGRFRARFGSQLALMHSGLSQGERFDEWHRLQRGDARIVIGARSALFAPLSDLGLIVVDEEHEAAYKQDQPPRYHAVAVARQRARLANAVLLLGSATPDVTRYHEAAAEHTDLHLLELPSRVDDRPLPAVEILDLRGQVLSSRDQIFSTQLLEAIDQRLNAGEQVMLFLNRRGFSTFVMCRDCGYALRCPDCDISLTYHHQSHTMRCHHCDYAHHVPDQCPNCQGHDVGFHGLGTERIADQVAREFPQAVVARMDRDTIGHKGAHGRILSAFASGEANILVGTQMIAKGHDFPRVTLVGVLNADTGLHRPDFRAGEITFQILTQVAGRAGRAERPGEVLVQTYNPEHYAIQAASRHDYRSFYEREMQGRARNLYPPFCRLARLVFASESDRAAATAASQFAQLLDQMGLDDRSGATHYLGPAEAPLRKLRGKYRHALLLKTTEAASLPDLTAEALGRYEIPNGVTVTVDVDPTDMM